MKGKLTLLPLAILLIGFASCKKVESDASKIKTLSDIKVPDGFDWQSSREVDFVVSMTDPKYGEVPQSVSIYNTAGDLLAKGFGTISHPFKAKLLIANAIKEVFIIKTSPDNINMSKKVALSSTLINESFGTYNPTGSSNKNNSTISSGPDCTADQTISVKNNESVTVSANKTVSVTGNNKTFSVTFDGLGGTLKICGTNLTVSNVNRNSTNVYIIVTDNATGIEFGSLELNSPSMKFDNYGDVTFNGNFSSPGIVNNHGTMEVQSNYNVNTSAIHNNYSTLIVKETLTNNSGTIYNNLGKVTAKQVKVQGTFNNDCQLYVTGVQDDALNVDNTLNNESYIEVTSGTKINSSGNLFMKSQAFVITKNLVTLDGAIRGSGTTSLFKVTGTLDASKFVNTPATRIYGPVDVCYAARTIPASLFDGTAKQSCDTSIPASGCILVGNGKAPTAPKDTDGDGVADNLDDDLNDPNVTAISYYPSSDVNSGSTVAFEDMWPRKGDYDMNDLVVSYRYTIYSKYTAGVNKVTKVKGNYRLYARGGNFHNGFGIQFPVARTKTALTGAGTLEAGQTNAVVILFSDMHTQMAKFNTIPGEALAADVYYEFFLNITDGPSTADFGIGEYNPFIWDRDAGRGSEIHLPNKAPTSLANLALFGTKDDRSNPATGKYYMSDDRFPWAISMAIRNFAYPIEGKDISSAYLKMPDWVNSGGVNYTDWYSNTASGYRNTANIFSR